ncbi:hypothetical protein [Pseudophaeobacter sp.]|uniref:hypothetical protein n=1 Tax=Pseudophaeobacter sp. TaxID=1971739 RepID=UPI00260DF7E2|nr:hypothetical protein [Pseudophaeobacter sp.]
MPQWQLSSQIAGFLDRSESRLAVYSPAAYGRSYDDSMFKFGAGVARDGCAIWQDAGVVASALLLIFLINCKYHQNELDIL